MDAAGAHGESGNRRRDAFLTQIQQRRVVLGAQFEAIDALGYRPQYDEAVDRVSRFLKQLPPDSHA